MLASLLIACMGAPQVDLATPDLAEKRRRCTVASPCAFGAVMNADVTSGTYPLTVAFDSMGSLPGAGGVTFAWDFGDGTESTTRAATTHTFVGAGDFVARLTLTDAAGAVATAEVAISVDTPACPTPDSPVMTGHVDDAEFDEISGLVTSPTDPEVFWVHEDSGNDPVLVAMNEWGQTLATHPLVGGYSDLEDLAIGIDPDSGETLMFLGDIGDNAYARGDVSVWVAEEPDLYTDGDVVPWEMELEYPSGARNAETLLVDPWTLDLYIVTKQTSSLPDIYVKRAPHAPGTWTLESLGKGDLLPYTATGGDISPDGQWIVIRDYSETAFLFPRDGYLPLEDAFSGTVCEIPIVDEQQGEAIAFTADGTALVTVSEGDFQPMYRIGL